MMRVEGIVWQTLSSRLEIPQPALQQRTIPQGQGAHVLKHTLGVPLLRLLSSFNGQKSLARRAFREWNGKDKIDTPGVRLLFVNG